MNSVLGYYEEDGEEYHPIRRLLTISPPSDGNDVDTDARPSECTEQAEAKLYR